LDNFYDRDNPDSAKREKYKENGTHLQKSGHGSICTTQKGDVYLCHLCGRPFIPEKCCTLGRETSIQKMMWTDDWLVMEDGSNLAKDKIPESGLKEVTWSSEIGKVKFNPWPEYLISPRIERTNWTTINNDGSITIKGQQSLCSLDRVSLIARQIRSVYSSFSTSLDFTPVVFQHTAGITMYYDNMNNISLVKTIEEGNEIIQLVSVENGTKKEYSKTLLTFKGTIDMKCTVNGKSLFFAYKSKNSEKWIIMENLFDTFKLSDEYSNYGEFTGTFCGIFASDLNKRDSYATFHYFNYIDELPCNVE
ncbi:MAG: family 43 glycosylhydrolase, partial [Spirochaetaceae bacterium]|nr:family 43 glycosylhydrolase [Spirochaetaceae bacterium]